MPTPNVSTTHTQPPKTAYGSATAASTPVPAPPPSPPPIDQATRDTGGTAIRRELGAAELPAGEIATRAGLPRWVPPKIAEDILRGVPEGLTRYRAEGQPDIIVSSRRIGGGLTSVELFQYLPESAEIHLAGAGGDAHLARQSRTAAQRWNREMKELVEDRGVAPGEAKQQLLRLHREEPRLLAGALGLALASVGTIGRGPGQILEWTSELIRDVSWHAAHPVAPH